MHVVAVVPAAVELVGADVAQLVFSGGLERVRGFVPFAGLRPNVAGHVQRVRNVGDQLRVAPAARPGILGEG